MVLPFQQSLFTVISSMFVLGYINVSANNNRRFPLQSQNWQGNAGPRLNSECFTDFMEIVAQDGDAPCDIPRKLTTDDIFGLLDARRAHNLIVESLNRSQSWQ